MNNLNDSFTQQSEEIDNDRIIEMANKGIERDKISRRSQRNEQMWMSNLQN